VSDYSVKHSRGGAQAYDLSPRERAICEKKASAGDIVAAKTLMEYYEMVVVDGKQYVAVAAGMKGEIMQTDSGPAAVVIYALPPRN